MQCGCRVDSHPGPVGIRGSIETSEHEALQQQCSTVENALKC